MPESLFMVLVVASRATVVGRGEPPSIRGFVMYPIEKVRPESRVRSGTVATVRAARNEREAVLVGLVNDGTEPIRIDGFDVEIPSPSYRVDAYEVAYFEVEKPTNPVGGGWKVGRWPDPLVPLTPAAVRAVSAPDREARHGDGPGGGAVPTATRTGPGNAG